MQERYNHLNTYLKSKFGERTLKICIDGHFTCPNRDGKVGTGGCIFCSKRGAGDLINNVCSSNESDFSFISEQVTNYFKSYRSKRANKFIAYFQNFTNTYDSLENLKVKYDSALIDDRIVALAVATRPDCIDENIVKLLKSYSEKYYVWVELGLQTANEKTGQLINRCYSNDDFSNAVQLLNEYGIDVVTHVMVGLPGESFDYIKKTVVFLNKHDIQGLKIHSCYVVNGSSLALQYLKGDYVPITLDEYINSACYILTHINPNIVIHRISGDAPKDLLLAPEWNGHKKWIMNGINKKLNDENLYQGMYYSK